MEDEKKSAESRVLDFVVDTCLPEKFRRMSGMEKLNALLDLPDAVSLIKRIEPQEFYFLVREIGRSDSTELIMYSSKEQLKAIFDMEVWIGDRFSPLRFAQWFDILLSCGFERSQEALSQIGDDVLINFIISQAEVSLKEDEQNILETDDFFPTHDGQLILKLKPDAEHVAELRTLVDLLYARDVNRANHQMHLLMWELRSSLEADSYHLRSARLQDMGFPPPDERFDIYKTVSLKEALAVAGRILGGNVRAAGADDPFELMEYSSLGLMLREGMWDNLLGAVVSSLENRREAGRFYIHFKYLVNKLLFARTDDLSDENEFKDASVHAASIVSLGLEYLSGGSIENARRIFEAFWLKQIYQVGWTLVYNLREEAKKIKKGIQAFELGSAEDHVIEGLLDHFPPLYWMGLNNFPKIGFRDFRSLADIEATRKIINGMKDLLRNR